MGYLKTVLITLSGLKSKSLHDFSNVGVDEMDCCYVHRIPESEIIWISFANSLYIYCARRVICVHCPVLVMYLASYRAVEFLLSPHVSRIFLLFGWDVKFPQVFCRPGTPCNTKRR